MTRLAAVILIAVAAVQPGLAFTSSRVQRPWVRGLRDNGDAGALVYRLANHGLHQGLYSTSASTSLDEPSNPSSEQATTADANRSARPAAAELPRNDSLGRGAVAALLVLLVMQNAGASLLTAAVRKTAPYDGASVALMQEIGKVPLIFAAFFYFQSRGARLGSNSSGSNSGGSDHSDASSAPPKETLRGVLRETFSKSALDLAIPSACFAAQNVLYFTALRHLDAATYSLLSQSKTAFTAIFFVTVLGQRLAGLQIVALALLMSGMALVQLGPLWSASAAAATTTAVAAAASTTAAAATAASFAVGSFAVLASSFSSGLANILFEKLVKFKGGSLYAKQLQLGLWTGAFTVAEILRRHGVGGLAWSTLTQDWTMGVWGIVCLKSVGGLLVAATIRYADNIVKTFATAAAILVTTAVTWHSGPPKGVTFLSGCGLVLASIFLYARGSHQNAKSSSSLPPPESANEAEMKKR